MTVNISSIEQKVNSLTYGSATTHEYFINMGPQHPSTHGVLRLILKLEGETIIEVIPVLGYIHRGIEKICESHNYRQYVHLTDRMDYLSALMNNWAVSKVVEKAANIELNDRIETIRTIMSELQRIQSHLLWWGVMGMDLGAITTFLYGFREREIITDIIEETTGARLTMNYFWPGGLMYDLHPNFVPRVKEFLKYFKPKIAEYDELLTGNFIFQERVRDIGVMSGETAVSLGATGPVLRASGIPYDLRKVAPYGVYNKVNFDVAVGSKGDSWDRYWVRIEEMRQSVSIIEQLIDNIPEGKFMVIKPAQKLRLPEGIHYTEVETARGILGVSVVSDGKEKPYRVHLRTPNYNNVWTLTKLAKGHRIADIVTIISSLDIVVPDIDR